MEFESIKYLKILKENQILKLELEKTKKILDLALTDVRSRNPELKNFPLALVYRIYEIKIEEE